MVRRRGIRVVIDYIFSKEKYETIITKFYDRNEKQNSICTNKCWNGREGILRNRLINDEGKSKMSSNNFDLRACHKPLFNVHILKNL